MCVCVCVLLTYTEFALQQQRAQQQQQQQQQAAMYGAAAGYPGQPQPASMVPYGANPGAVPCNPNKDRHTYTQAYTHIYASICTHVFTRRWVLWVL
jgi:hypothetical protein